MSKADCQQLVRHAIEHSRAWWAEYREKNREKIRARMRGWRAVGCKKSKAQRLEIAAIEGRILIKEIHELDMYRKVLAALPPAR